jgi:DNA-binding transcriptional LysR family regulator
MSLSQIEYFVAVAEHGHVGRAAERLRIAQPAVSRQIRRLEDELGADLFVRTPRGMTLSRAGERFLRRARVIMQNVRDAATEIRDASRS